MRTEKLTEADVYYLVEGFSLAIKKLGAKAVAYKLGELLIDKKHDYVTSLSSEIDLQITKVYGRSAKKGGLLKGRNLERNLIKIMLLHKYSKLSIAEIARIMGETHSNVSKKVSSFESQTAFKVHSKEFSQTFGQINLEIVDWINNLELIPVKAGQQ